MTIKEQQNLIEELTKIMYQTMHISNGTWDRENDTATDQWRIVNNLCNNFRMTIKHLNDICPPWED